MNDTKAGTETNSIKSPISGTGEPIAISIPEMKNLLECPNQSYVPDPNHCPYAEAVERLNEQCENGINQTTFGKPIFP